jgi:hypothetical protein
MNDIVKGNGSTAVGTTGLNFFQEYGEATRQTAIVGQLLKFSKGDWTAGQDDEPIDEGSTFIANMDELLVGWVRWSQNKPTDHVMGKVVHGYQPPRRNELGDNDQDQWEVGDDGNSRDPWQLTNYLLLQGTEEELYTFTTSSKGGINAVGDLCVKYGKQLRQHPNDYPVIKIGTGSYMHQNKSYGRIKYPMFEIVGWVKKSAFVEAAGDERTPGEVDEVDVVTDTPASVEKKAKQAKKVITAAAVAAKAQPAAKAKTKPRF